MFDPEWLDDYYKEQRHTGLAPEKAVDFDEIIEQNVEMLFDDFKEQNIETGDYIICHKDGHVVTQLEDKHREKLESSSYLRFYHRLGRFKARKKNFPRTRHAFWWLMHNCAAHIAIGLVPIKASFELHDWTSKKLNTP